MRFEYKDDLATLCVVRSQQKKKNKKKKINTQLYVAFNLYLFCVERMYMMSCILQTEIHVFSFGVKVYLLY